MAKTLTKRDKLKMILARMLAVFIANGLAIIGAGSIIGIDTLSSILLAGSLGVAKVTEALARGYLNDGKLTIDEIDDAFGSMGKKKSWVKIQQIMVWNPRKNKRENRFTTRKSKY